MTLEYQIKYWLDSASHDLEVAETLFKEKKFDWCLFIGHLVIEKVLKAFYVRDKKEAPPKIHNLVKLSEKTNIKLNEEQKKFLVDINDFNIEVRYPDYKQAFYKICTKGFTFEYFNKIKEFYKWLKEQIK